MDLTDVDKTETFPRLGIEGRVVGIGASAGGLESLEQLFSSLPRDTGMAFVVVQHLSPDFRSLMDELIARHSDMPVVLVQHGMPVEPNRIHLMPPGKEMICRDRHLWLTDKEPHTFTLPIDSFFRSLAQDLGPQAVAVVLSGSGSDGSRGIVEVKQAGGLVLAEISTTAKFDGMPLAAAASGAVDRIGPPSDLARILCGLPPLETAQETQVLSDDPHMDAALRLLRDTFGIDFSLYKTTTVGRRIQRRIEILRLWNLADYVELLRSDPAELDKLYQDLLIGVTQFFRDPEAFQVLEREVIPKLLESLKPSEELRVWIAGCATGEEAYSLAMLLWEAFAAANRAPRIKILATDVHQRSLDHASAGVYGEEQLAHVTAERLERFFTKRTSGYQISADLRQLIVFARHNILKDAPFTKMHFISCRNMLIYLQPQAQRMALSLFHFGLVSGGTLFLGASETPGVLGDEFTSINEHWKLFKKRRDVHLLGQVRLPSLGSKRRNSLPAPLLEIRRTGTDPLILATYDQLLDMFMPPSLLIDEQHNLIDCFAGAEKLLQVKARRPSNNVLELLGDDLRTVASGAIQRALKDNASVSYSGVRLPKGDEEVRCTVTAQPVVHPRTNARNVLLMFKEIADEVKPSDAPPTISVAEASAERLATLETELGYTRETLQATIEELETSNEEMQATNEELVASNEELQSTNEELHSVNEELYTVNAEYQQKITELKELNADMAHLLEGTDVGTVFLDCDLQIRRFTSQIAKVFRFHTGDIGRRISDFSHNIERPQLMEEIESVREKGILVEDEVRDRNGVPYFLRILPYRIAQKLNGQSNGHSNGHGNGVSNGQPEPIAGVVLTLTDMTALDGARTRIAQLSDIVEFAHDAMFSHTLDGTITTWNRGAEKLFGYTAATAIGNNISILIDGDSRKLGQLLGQIAIGEKIEHDNSLCLRSDGTKLDVSASLSPIYSHSTIVGAAVNVRDIAKLTEVQHALEDEQRKVKALLAETENLAQLREQFLAMLSHELRNPLAAVLSATTLLDHAMPEVAARCHSVIRRQATHMKRLLDDLLDVSRITTDKLRVERNDIDLHEAIETAIEATTPLLAQREVTLRRRVIDRELPVKGDVRRLTQVIGNLLANAANYSPPNTEVELSVTVDNGKIVIHCRDHGDGIDPALQPRIFDLFVQAEQKLDRSRGGLGVGLSLAKAIVALHGGTISVHSAGVGHGSDFQVVLPIGVSVAETQTEQRPSPCRIVLVDDQEDSREMLRLMFESKNHEVFDASDGGTAVDLIAAHKPHVAFIDIGLPVMNGFEVAQQIRRRRELDAVTLVALSGYGNHSDVNAALAAGFDEHVTKPAEFARLEQILARKRPSTEA